MKIKRKVDKKNRVVIPIDILNQLNIKGGDEILLDIEKGKLTIEKVKKK